MRHPGSGWPVFSNGSDIAVERQKVEPIADFIK
jgi:hypothetical protein